MHNLGRKSKTLLKEKRRNTQVNYRHLQNLLKYTKNVFLYFVPAYIFVYYCYTKLYFTKIEQPK